jgi:hypothetical protein
LKSLLNRIFHTRVINTGLPARWNWARKDPSRFNGFYEVREAVETAAVILYAVTPGWKPGVNERAIKYPAKAVAKHRRFEV